MDVSPLSRPCFGCKLFPMKTIVFIFLLSLSTRAEEPVRKTVAECLYLQGRVESQLEELRKHPPPPQDKPGPTDNSNRMPQAMTHNEAIDYCNGLGGRLPTALELAQLAIKQGGKNIAQPSDEHDHSYKPVDARNPDGSLDHFLFSYRNYPYGALTQGIRHPGSGVRPRRPRSLIQRPVISMPCGTEKVSLFRIKRITSTPFFCVK